MVETIKAYFESLEGLSTEALTSSAEKLVRPENFLKHMAEIFERAVDISLEKKDPKRKRERRLERQRAKAAPRPQPRPDEISTRPERKDRAESRYIPFEVRERVFERAGHQCQYRSADGTRCSARTRLRIEHVRPFAI